MSPDREDTSSSRSGRPKRRHPDIEVARLLVKRKFVSQEDALAALKEQKQRAHDRKPRLRLVQVLVKKKALAASKVAQIQDEIRRHTYICDACAARTVLAPSSRRSESLCPRCGAVVHVEPPSGPSQTSEPRRDFGSTRDLTFPGPPGLDKFEKNKRAFGRYELVEEIGRGAMGVVYRARHVELGKEVALKVLLAGEEARDAQIARFRREAAAVQRLRHDGIVPIHDFGAEGDVYYLTMDLVPGGLTLHRLLKDEERAPPLKERLRLVAKVAQAIDHANRRGVIHRDLKPANVLIAPDGTPRIADFGLAKDQEDEAELTLSQDRLGTPLFMAPEQVKRGSRGVDNRADIWALGVMTFVAITGRYPFRGRTIMSLYMKILNEEPDWTGLASSSPDREGFGKAPSPREMARLSDEKKVEETIGADTEVASHRGARLRDRPRSERLERPPDPPPFVPPPDLEGKEVPKDLRRIVEMALAKDPDSRYDSARALALDLERFCQGEEVRARPPGVISKLLRRARRRRVLLLSIPLAIAVPLLIFFAKARAEKQAELQRQQRAADALARTEEVWSRHVGVGAPTFEAYERAARDLAPVCSAFADEPAPFIRRGQAYAFTLEPEKARDDFVRAEANLESEPRVSTELARAGALLALLRGEDERACSLAYKGLAQDPKDERLATILARALLHQGKNEAAERALAPLVQPKALGDLLATAAEVALALGDAKKATERAALASNVEAEDPHASAVLGLAAFATGRTDEARRLLTAARESFDGHAQGDARYFYLLAKARRLDRAHKDLEGALHAGALATLLAPWSPVPGFWRADLLRKDRRDPKGATEQLDDCLARDPLFEEAAQIRSELLLARRTVEGLSAATERFRDEIKKTGRERARVDLATILVGQGRLEEAATLLSGISERPFAQRSLLLRAEIEARAGRSGKELLAEYDGQADRSGMYRRRDMIALARARLIAHDYQGTLAALDRVPEAPDPRWVLFNRIPSSFDIIHALRATAQAALGKDDQALSELRHAGTQSGSDMAAEATLEILKETGEFDPLRADGRFEALEHRGGAD